MNTGCAGCRRVKRRTHTHTIHKMHARTHAHCIKIHRTHKHTLLIPCIFTLLQCSTTNFNQDTPRGLPLPPDLPCCTATTQQDHCTTARLNKVCILSVHTSCYRGFVYKRKNATKLHWNTLSARFLQSTTEQRE